MSEHNKQYDDLEEMLKAVKTMRKFQKIHNVIKPDFLILLNITDERKSNENEFDALYRACLTRIFSLIEADMYSLNQLEMYENYDDKKDRFIKKFKETYKQICKTWNKVEVQNRYFDSKLYDLIELKKKRDELVHPKQIDNIHKASDKDFEILKKVFEDYDKFINDLMNNFFLSTTIPTKL